jgi:hypothetical protein
MRKWSDELIKLSKEYLNYDGTSVKSLNGDFGILNVDYKNNGYTIDIHESDQVLTFKSVDEIINAGWAVD